MGLWRLSCEGQSNLPGKPGRIILGDVRRPLAAGSVGLVLLTVVHLALLCGEGYRVMAMVCGKQAKIWGNRLPDAVQKRCNSGSKK